jgi:hypothetical protein
MLVKKELHAIVLELVKRVSSFCLFYQISPPHVVKYGVGSSGVCTRWTTNGVAQVGTDYSTDRA